MYSLAAKVQTNSEKKTTKLYFHTQVFTGDPKTRCQFREKDVVNTFLNKVFSINNNAWTFVLLLSTPKGELLNIEH